MKGKSSDDNSDVTQLSSDMLLLYLGDLLSYQDMTHSGKCALVKYRVTVI